MAINKNHLFDDLNGIKCAIVETVVSTERVNFIKSLLEFNKFTVVVVPSPPPKAAAVPAPTTTVENVIEHVPAPAAAPEKFTVGVTDVTFNVTNAIYGRLLHTPDKRVVTMAYWLQKESISKDEIPYFDRKF